MQSWHCSSQLRPINLAFITFYIGLFMLPALGVNIKQCTAASFWMPGCLDTKQWNYKWNTPLNYKQFLEKNKKDRFVDVFQHWAWKNVTTTHTCRPSGWVIGMPRYEIKYTTNTNSLIPKSILINFNFKRFKEHDWKMKERRTHAVFRVPLIYIIPLNIHIPMVWESTGDATQ